MTALKIGVLGAGAIGCYVGGRLLAASNDVTLIARQSIVDEMARGGGLHLTDFRGFDKRVPADRVRTATSPEALADRDVVIVTVKGGDTAAAGAQLASVLRDAAVVVSLQNGVSNPERLRAVLPQHAAAGRVLGAMVPFNVVRAGDGHFHQATSGRIAIQRGNGDVGQRAAALVDALSTSGIAARLVDDIDGILWGKLLVNLNNSVNALAGVPIRQMIRDRAYRLVMAAAIDEAVRVLEVARIPARLEPPVPPGLVPKILRLPNALFGLISGRIIKVDGDARSSMWDDLQRRRKTEVDGLNGEIVKVAERVGVDAKVNRAICALVHDAEARGEGSPGIGSATLRERVGLA